MTFLNEIPWYGWLFIAFMLHTIVSLWLNRFDDWKKRRAAIQAQKDGHG